MKNGELVVLMTGANGFVGRNIAPVLEANGLTVRRAVRTPSHHPGEVVIDAIGPQTDWSKALSNVDAIVHLAGRVHHPRDSGETELYRILNTDGTLHLARCAANAGVRHFVYMSTILVNGGNTDGRSPFREDDRPAPRGGYGLSKVAAEDGLRAMANDMKMSVTVIRPPLIYGRGAVGNFKLLAAAVSRGIPLPFGLIRNRRSFLGTGNLASFVLHRLAHPTNGFEVFLVADDEEISTPEFIRRIGSALGKTARIVPVPSIALKALFSAAGRPEAYTSVAGSLMMDISKARNTGWKPRISLDEGLRLSMPRS
jgi:UDP-glucose 4-epimerase